MNKKVITYLGILCVICPVFYFLSIRAGGLQGGSVFVMGLMWVPALAAICTKLIYDHSLKGIGWKIKGWKQKGHTHKEVIVKLHGSIAVCYAVLLFLCRSMVCLFSSCSSSPIKFHTICIFCLRCPLDLSGAWTMIFFTNSLTIVGVSSRIPTYLRIIAAKLSKSDLSCS